MSIDYISKLQPAGSGRFELSVFVLLLALTAVRHEVTVEVPRPVLISVDDLVEIHVPGMYQKTTDDYGQVPAGRYFFPVPPGADPVLEWVVEETSRTGWDERMPLSSAPVAIGTGFEAREERASMDIPPAHQPVSLEIVDMLGTTVAVVSVSPFSYGSPSIYASRISFALNHDDAPGGRPVGGTLLEHLCPGADTWWPRMERSPESPFWGRPWARIQADETGFYSVTCQELEAAGCQVSGVPSQTLAMFSGPGEMFDPEDRTAEHQLHPVAISVEDGGDGVFGQGDSLVFYGRGLWSWRFTSDSLYRAPHRYDRTNTFWLTWGGQNGARITAAEAQPSGGTPVESGTVPFGFEEEVLSNHQGNRTGWLWGFIFENTPSYFYLGSPFQSDLATFRLAILKAGTTPWDHNLVAELDGTVVLDTIAWGIRHEYYSLDSISVSSGGNMLKLWSDWHGSTYLDYAELLVPVRLAKSAGYPAYLTGIPPGPLSLSVGPVSPEALIYDITDPYSPVELTGWTLADSTADLTHDPGGDFAVLLAVEPRSMKSPLSIEPAQPGRILGASSEGDVLVAVPGDMYQAAQMLHPIYSSRGQTVYMATYQEIYDEFGQGVSDPGAVRSFVRWALDTWVQKPSALLLIGDGSSDPLGYNTGYETQAPIYFELPSGNCKEAFFTMVHQGSEFPELPVSRIPAGTANELFIALQKSYEMEIAALPGPWENTVILAADDEWGKSKTESEHTETCELLADSVLPRSLNVVKHYLIDYPWPPGTTGEGAHPEKPEAASDLIDLLNSGASSVSFFGHGSYDQMASEKLMSSGMVSQMVNQPRYFLYNSFSCNNGEFSLPAGDCLAEVLLFHPEGGAAASISCTGISFSTQNRNLSSSFLGNIYGDARLPLAEAFWLSVVTLGDNYNLLYCVLGDGGLQIPAGNTGPCQVVSPDTLFRGRNNTVQVSFPAETSFLFRCRESAGTVTYVSPLSQNFSLSYLRYGSPVYQGINTTDPQGQASIEFFVPLQADTGSLGRADGTGGFEGDLATGYSWPIPVFDDGVHDADSTGPLIELEFVDSEPGDIPSVYQNAVLHAMLSDPSGICVLGEDAGSIIICSIDGEYDDVTELFTFYSGSSTSGSLEYQIPELLPGLHQVRIVAKDGMKNTGEAILDFNVLEGEPPLLEETGVFPNPHRGTRAFFFTTGSQGTVEATVFTVAGRPIWSGETAVSPGTGQIVWSGLDADGDPLAAGAYVYMLRYSGVSGSASVTGILAVSP